MMHFHSCKNHTVFNAFTKLQKSTLLPFSFLVNLFHNFVLFFFSKQALCPERFFVRWLYGAQMYFPILIKECMRVGYGLSIKTFLILCKLSKPF